MYALILPVLLLGQIDAVVDITLTHRQRPKPTFKYEKDRRTEKFTGRLLMDQGRVLLIVQDEKGNHAGWGAITRKKWYWRLGKDHQAGSLKQTDDVSLYAQMVGLLLRGKPRQEVEQWFSNRYYCEREIGQWSTYLDIWSDNRTAQLYRGAKDICEYDFQKSKHNKWYYAALRHGETGDEQSTIMDFRLGLNQVGCIESIDIDDRRKWGQYRWVTIVLRKVRKLENADDIFGSLK